MGGNKLNPEQIAVQTDYLRSVKTRIISRKTSERIVVGMVGLIGSGKTTTAKRLAERLGAVVIRGDDIRLLLRKHGQRYEPTRLIAENVVGTLVAEGCSVVIDTDFVDREKRIALEDKIGARAKVLYIRTFCDPDVHFARIRNADYQKYPNIYTVASSVSEAADKEVDVRLREFWRRTPRHYRWEDYVGGRWVLRSMPFAFVEIDTTDEARSGSQIEEIIHKIGNF